MLSKEPLKTQKANDYMMHAKTLRVMNLDYPFPLAKDDDPNRKRISCQTTLRHCNPTPNFKKQHLVSSVLMEKLVPDLLEQVDLKERIRH